MTMTKRSTLFLCAFLVAVVLLAIGPARHALILHEAVAEALLDGLSWGRQSIAASIHCPSLPVIAFTALTPIARLLHLATENLYSALCLAGIILLIMNCFRSLKKAFLLGFLPFILLAFLARNTAVDWLPILLLLCLFRNLFLWRLWKDLRHATYTAVLCGLLILCGIAMSILGVGCALFIGFRHPVVPQPMNKTLAFFPAGWAIFLLVLWSWLIVGSPLYRPRMLWRLLRMREQVPTMEYLKKTREEAPALPPLTEHQCIFLCGPLLPALYPITQNHNLVASLTFQKETLRASAREKTAFLFIPPPELNLLPQLSELQQLYGKGAAWLILDSLLPDGWELYRIL